MKNLNRKSYILLFLSCFVFSSVKSQQEVQNVPRWKDYIDLDNYVQPFWKSDVIYDEIIQPIKNDKETTAQLLFKAKKVLSITDAYIGKNYQEGVDWKYKNGKIIFNELSDVPYFTQDELLFDVKKPGVSMEGKKDKTYVLFSEGGLFQSRQLAVTYIKDKKSKWKGPIPAFSEEQLPRTISKLKNSEAVNIVFYGNSIEAGANSSSTINMPPYAPTWPEMTIHRLKSVYGGKVNFENNSKGGMLASWGVENASELVASKKPDLVVIGFGMNDGTFLVKPEVFAEQIESMMNEVRSTLPQCEFIVITPMLANPYAIQNQIQEQYKSYLFLLQKKGVVLADMTGVHQELLNYKSYQDMTGNNVNHPNDYLARWYAQIVSAVLIP